MTPSEAALMAWFPYLLVFAVLWIVGLFAFGVLRRIQAGEPILSSKTPDAVFQEAMASGRNLRNIITRIGGASRCLVVAVTDSRLKADLIFPFNLFIPLAIYGLKIDIPLAAIRSIERRRRFLMGEVVVVRWADDGGYEFKVGDPTGFIRAIDPQGRLIPRATAPS